jgi:4-hydroxy-4-methyl-2-oxoglutarate aldolase
MSRTAWSAALASDALDELGLFGQVMHPGLRPLWPDAVLAGPVLTIQVETTSTVLDPDDPYRSEIDAVDALRPGHVPIYAAPDGNLAALWGELFTRAATARGASGAIVDGYVRDTRLVRALGFPVFARGCSPLDTRARARVSRVGGPLVAGGVAVAPGDFVVADEDGVVVIPSAALADATRIVQSKDRSESGARADLGEGGTLDAVWAKWRAL